MSTREQRSHFRIHYPPADRPEFKISSRSFQIDNISEEGVCIVFKGVFTLAVGDEIRGTIHFRSGKTHAGRGKIIRKLEGKIIFTLHDPVPLPLIMEEQRMLLKKYKTLIMAP